MTRKIERIVIDASKLGRGHVEINREVAHSIRVNVDCGCYLPRHTHGFDFDIIITDMGAVYVRAHGDHVFRELDNNGPITVSVRKESINDEIDEV
jgi:hypothetical protein